VLISSPLQIFRQPFRGGWIGLAERVHKFAVLQEQGYMPCRIAPRLATGEETARRVNFIVQNVIEWALLAFEFDSAAAEDRPSARASSIAVSTSSKPLD
jgi:hypothetical protein